MIMKNAMLFDSLQSIRDLYSQIHDATATLAADSEPEAFVEVTQTRQAYLDTIEQERLKLDRTCGRWRKAVAAETGTQSLMQEIDTLIDSITRLDNDVQQVMAGKMAAIRQELAGLKHQSKAAAAYTNQSRH
jgi:hypothetical protein